MSYLLESSPEAADPGGVAVAPEDLGRVLALYEDGLYLRAYELARALGPLEAWSGTAGRLLAGRLAIHVGAPGLGRRLHARAWREDRADAEACYYRARERLGRRGPLRAWAFLKRVGPLDGAPEASRADWLAVHAVVLGHLRDFDAADAWLARAEAESPGRAWVQVERAQLLELEDRYEEALGAARRALELRPWYRPAVQATAHHLQLLDRRGEALELLREAAGRLESGPLVLQLAALQEEMGHHDDARRSLERFAELSPLMEEDVRRWLEGRRSDVAYALGDVGAAIAHARASDSPFFLALADRLEGADAGARRVVLDVEFVRQHHQTCSPATLAALARFWGMPADHLEVAEAICYDGTSDDRERDWAEHHGAVAREFTVTWDAAVALLDRGVPFALTTVEPLSGHLQAVIGYDGRRRTLLLRDPTLPHSGEAYADGLLERYRASGPRGMVLVPRGRAALLEGIELPEAALYDHVYRLRRALERHDRDGAAAALAALREEAPGHRLTHHARRHLAAYDADVTEQLAAVEALLGLFPEDVNLRLTQLACLRDLSRRDDRLALLGELCDRRGADPLFLRRLAQELLADAREHPKAVRLALRALRARPLDESCVAILAEVAWDARRLGESLELWRLASCLDDKDEGLARAYFAAARHLRREGETLRLLEGRFRRFGKRSSAPARTLAWALARLERMDESFEVLDEALRLRPEDGELLLHVAEARASHGQSDRADAHLVAAEGHCRRADWLRAAAGLASARADLPGALALWRRVLEVEPAALDAHRAAARLLAETEGPAAASEHLARACERFPHNYALHQARVEWLRGEGPAAQEPAVRRVLEIDPCDAWAYRELALVLSEQGRHDEAAAAMGRASELEPSSANEASVRGQVLERAGRREEAAEAYREAVRRSADHDFAIARLIDACDTPEGRREALAFVAAELERQVTFGDGLIAFARQARGILDADELLAALRRAWDARPDLWQSWSALVREHLRRGDRDEALDLARRAASRFPLLPRAWLDVAAVHEAREDRDGEVEALRRALQLGPGWGAAARQLAQALERGGDFAASRAVLERAVAHGPREACNHGCLADALWHLDEREPAFERLRHALRLDPEYDWAWETLRAWSGELGRPGAPADLARELASARGGEAGVWLRLARELDGPDDLDERLAALDRAIALDPRLTQAHDLKAELLAEAGRFDEASAACRPPAWGDRPPCPLLGRAAWVEARRGDLPAAIAAMRPVVAENPDYSWGLRHLAEWTCDAGTPAEYLEAADAMVRNDPDDPVAWAYRGEARLKAEERGAARDDFRRAVELAPRYNFAAVLLFDLEFERGDLDAAGRVLEPFGARSTDEFVIAREVQLAAKLGDAGTALEALRRLCEAPHGGSDWPLRTADRAFARARWGERAWAAYAEILERPAPPPMVATLWGEHLATRNGRGLDRLDALLGRGEVGLPALAAYLQALGRRKDRRAVDACRRRYLGVLREDTHGWGTLGYALTTLGRHRAAAGWLRDWPGRDAARPWMLINLVLSLRALGRVGEANRVGRHALGLDTDYTSAYHATWLALDEAIDGDPDAADARLGRIDPSPFDATNRYLHRLAGLVIRQRLAAPGGRRRVFAETRRGLAALGRAEAIPSEDHGAVARTYARAVRRLAADSGAPRPLWRLARAIDPPRRAR
jgi:tetratricopeptide (TPR) repeat protein